jgi:hypothetical protein
MKDAKGDAQFIGESQLSDIPSGGEVVATISKAFDIQVTPKVTAQQGNSWWGTSSVEYKVSNASDQAVTVEVEQTNLYSPITGQIRVTTENITGQAIDAFRHIWQVAVPAHGETILAVTYGATGN